MLNVQVNTVIGLAFSFVILVIATIYFIPTLFNSFKPNVSIHLKLHFISISIGLLFSYLFICYILFGYRGPCKYSESTQYRIYSLFQPRCTRSERFTFWVLLILGFLFPCQLVFYF